jgi:hypothetical protein
LIRTKSENCCQLARSPRLTAGLDKSCAVIRLLPALFRN